MKNVILMLNNEVRHLSELGVVGEGVGELIEGLKHKGHGDFKYV